MEAAVTLVEASETWFCICFVEAGYSTSADRKEEPTSGTYSSSGIMSSLSQATAESKTESKTETAAETAAETVTVVGTGTEIGTGIGTGTETGIGTEIGTGTGTVAEECEDDEELSDSDDLAPYVELSVNGSIV